MWPFAEGIRAGVGAVMTSYNDVSAFLQNFRSRSSRMCLEMKFQVLPNELSYGHFPQPRKHFILLNTVEALKKLSARAIRRI